MAADDSSDLTSAGSPELTTQSLAGSPDGATITGRYRLLEQLGVGGMGEVYRAQQTHPIQRTVAVKIIKRGMDTKHVIARFEIERQALALMDHPSIARVFDAGSTPRGRPYFVMEYVKGVPITQYSDTQKLTTGERLALFIRLCDGVQHAHQKAILHRDLKPSNVLVTVEDDKPVPKIIDFGVAKATAQKLSDATVYTELGELIGTPDYMSPEQAEMTAADVDTRTDVYSLGVILYELLAGALPFEPKELRKAGYEGIVRMIREQEPPPPSARWSTLGTRMQGIAEARRTSPDGLRRVLRGDLDSIVMQALEKDRTRRYGSPREFAADLERYLRHEPVHASPPSTTYRIRKFVKRHRMGVAAAATVVGALVLGIIGTSVGFLRATRAQVEARRDAETAQQVSDFLVGLFSVSNPSEARGNSITAREILDKGAAKIQEELADQPLVQARLMATMGNVYKELGLYQEARPLLEQALETRRQQLGDDHIDVAASCEQLAILLAQMGDYDNARVQHEAALEIREAELGPDDLAVAQTLTGLANLLADTGQYSEAKPLYERALTIREKALGPEDPTVAASMHNLAILLKDTGDLAEARLLHERALAIREKALGPDHPELAFDLHNTATVLSESGDYDAARSLFERALALDEKTLGPDHPRVGGTLNNLAVLLQNTGDLEGALPLYERALRIFENALGPDHFRVGATLANLGDILTDMGQLEEARSYCERALEIDEKALGPDHPYVGEDLHNLANLLQDMGEYDDARPLYERAAVIFEEKLGEDHPNVLVNLVSYAQLLRKLGADAEAERAEARAQAMREKAETDAQ